MVWHRITQMLSALAIIAMLGTSLTAVYSLSHGMKFLSVQSGSMVPTFRKGDLVVVTRIPSRQLAVGDVVTFISPALHNQTVTHRLVKVPDPNAKMVGSFQTRGDANPAADQPIVATNIVGKVVHSVPYVGFGLDFARKPLGLLILIYVPAMLVVIAEIKRLMKYYKSQEAYVAPGFDPNAARPVAAVAHPQAKRAAKASAVAMIAAVGVAVPVVHAALASSATLTNTSIRTFAPANNLLIYKVAFSGVASSTSTSTATNNVTNVNVINNNSQSATSGSATVSGTTNGGSATSGNASNSSTSNTTINISYGNGSAAGGGASQTVTLYNPTNQSINLAGWKLADNGTTQVIVSGTVGAKGYFSYGWPVTGGLNILGDRLSLRNPSSAVIDGLSWGSDTSQLNPPVFTSAASTSLTRKVPAFDTNSASDWQVAP